MARARRRSERRHGRRKASHWIANELQTRIGLSMSLLIPGPPERFVYVCNCNGIRERDARAAIDKGARRPVDVIRQCGGRLQCGKCVSDIRRMIQSKREAMRHAAE
jgi:bacterioferritin-associated ferredoxin